MSNRFRLAALLSLIAGFCDTTTGLLLVTRPDLTLNLMGIRDFAAIDAAGGAIFLRWVGVFVGSVGLAYLYPWFLGLGSVLPSNLELRSRLHTVFEVTSIVRCAVAAFVAVSVVTGALSWPWLSVAATDLTLAVLQVVALRGGWFELAREASDSIGRKQPMPSGRAA
jgi:hypothetical protein